jgi:ketosteroid isomerase-like protein
MEPAMLAQRFVDAFNARDEEVLRALYHPDARTKRPTWPSEGDVQASLDAIRLDFGAYPDGRIQVRQIVVQAREAVVEFQFQGTNTEPLTLFNGQEVPATGRPLRLGGVIMLEFDADGLITSERQFCEVLPLVEFWISLGMIRT